MTKVNFHQHAHHFCSSGWGQLHFSGALRHTVYGPGKQHSAGGCFLIDPCSSHWEDWACWANKGTHVIIYQNNAQAEPAEQQSPQEEPMRQWSSRESRAHRRSPRNSEAHGTAEPAGQQSSHAIRLCPFGPLLSPPCLSSGARRSDVCILAPYMTAVPATYPSH